MLTAEEYRQSIRDGRASYLEGRRIEDPVTHPLLRVSVDWVASTYDRMAAAGAGARNPIFDQPTTPDELDEQMNFLIEADVTAASTAGCMALGNAPAWSSSCSGAARTTSAWPRPSRTAASCAWCGARTKGSC
jgi:aromatic ring hydroxylase